MGRDAAFDYLDANRDRLVNELMEFLRIPSISALPEHDADGDQQKGISMRR